MAGPYHSDLNKVIRNKDTTLGIKTVPINSFSGILLVIKDVCCMFVGKEHFYPLFNYGTHVMSTGSIGSIGVRCKGANLSTASELFFLYTSLNYCRSTCSLQCWLFQTHFGREARHTRVLWVLCTVTV